MSVIYEYTSGEIYFHHSKDIVPDPEAFTMHTHCALEILCVISGKGKTFIEGNYYDLIPGCVFIMRSSESHKLHIETDVPYERIALHFPDTLLLGIDPEKYYLQPFNNRHLGVGNRFTQEETGINFKEMLLSMIPDDFSSDYFKRLAITSALPQLLFELEKFFSKNHRVVSSEPTRDVIAAVIDYINSHLFDDFSLETLSDEFYISKSYLNRKFKAATGSTLWNYVLIKRLMIAREQIRAGQPATKIFASCGFKDYSGFYRKYKLYFGISPKDDKASI